MKIIFSFYDYKGFYYAVGGVFERWFESKPKYYLTSIIDKTQHRFESLEDAKVQAILNCLDMVKLECDSTILIDDYVWITEDGKKLKRGLGMALQDALADKLKFRPTIIGISTKQSDKPIPYCQEIYRGVNNNLPIYVTSSEYALIEYDVMMVKRMHGDGRIPTLLECVKKKVKEYNSEPDI
jgi:hypothetical protein